MKKTAKAKRTSEARQMAMFLRGIAEWTGARGPIWAETRRLLTRQFGAAMDAERAREREEWLRRQLATLNIEPERG